MLTAGRQVAADRRRPYRRHELCQSRHNAWVCVTWRHNAWVCITWIGRFTWRDVMSGGVKACHVVLIPLSKTAVPKCLINNHRIGHKLTNNVGYFLSRETNQPIRTTVQEGELLSKQTYKPNRESVGWDQQQLENKQFNRWIIFKQLNSRTIKLSAIRSTSIAMLRCLISQRINNKQL